MFRISQHIRSSHKTYRPFPTSQLVDEVNSSYENEERNKTYPGYNHQIFKPQQVTSPSFAEKSMLFIAQLNCKAVSKHAANFHKDGTCRGLNILFPSRRRAGIACTL